MIQLSSNARRLALALAVTGHVASAGIGLAQVRTEQKETPPGYVLGPDDVILVTALDVDAIPDQPIRIDASGHIGLPMVGRIKAAGSSVEILEQTILDGLKLYLHHPEVSVNVVEYRSRPISVLGAVKSPGVQQLAGSKTLAEALSAAGGLEPDAGSIVMITRRREWGPLPLANSRESGEFNIGHVDTAALLQAQQPGANIQVAPHDVITVPRARVVYVIGEVRKAGPVLIREGESISVLKALSTAEGALRNASVQRARILRRRKDGSLAELTVKLQSIMNGAAPDVTLVADDILFIPNNNMKAGTLRAIEGMIQLGTGLLVWR